MWGEAGNISLMKIIITLTFEPVAPALQVSSETARWPVQQTLAEEGIHPWSESTPEPLVALVKDCRQSLAHCQVHLKSEKKKLRWNHHLRTVFTWALIAIWKDWWVLELPIHWACLIACLILIYGICTHAAVCTAFVWYGLFFYIFRHVWLYSDTCIQWTPWGLMVV